jgi:hypothetical protein
VVWLGHGQYEINEKATLLIYVILSLVKCLSLSPFDLKVKLAAVCSGSLYAANDTSLIISMNDQDLIHDSKPLDHISKLLVNPFTIHVSGQLTEHEARRRKEGFQSIPFRSLCIFIV